MIENDDIEQRHLIPRWLTIKSAIESGMMARPGLMRLPAHARMWSTQNEASIEVEFQKLGDIWRKTKELVDAEEYITASVFRPSPAGDLVDAAKQIIAAGISTPQISAIARRIVPETDQDSFVNSPDENSREEIRNRKSIIQLNPNDALLLTETALIYTNVGQNNQSERLLRRALAIAPNSRYVIRSAARFFCHIGQPDHALWIIRRSARHSTDPWLKSAELAIASYSGAQIPGWRKTKAMIEDESLSARDRSELACEVATLELDAGARRSAIRKLVIGARDPSENAIAQIEFLMRKSSIDSNSEIAPDVSRSKEATAYRTYWKHDLESALTACEEWQGLEPFSSRPGVFGSFLSTCRLQNIRRGLSIAATSLTRNPKNAALLNNLAVLSAYAGDLGAARSYASKSRVCEEDRNTVANLATEGLILFREGAFSEALAAYKRAMEQAAREGKYELLLRAYAYLTREVTRVDPTLTGSFLEEFAKVDSVVQSRGISVPVDVQLMRHDLSHHSETHMEAGRGDLKVDHDLLRILLEFEPRPTNGN